MTGYDLSAILNLTVSYSITYRSIPLFFKPYDIMLHPAYAIAIKLNKGHIRIRLISNQAALT